MTNDKQIQEVFEKAISEIHAAFAQARLELEAIKDKHLNPAKEREVA
jgi:hypothetical protein